ncbi:nuclear transport factor 2 family protein [Mucilaginibacter limnophilus]|uniref:Nuclear transport factor 2 family protein n=2 Tax=Mucilaginibacter limnophilus TaxID=1932778 RepID=A0A3S2WVS3_9SPHI|nr:nuclear transport factor 2 family protein [Mucilaginibacter limnophilus]
MENTAQLLEDSLLRIWNDRDAQRRLEIMKDVYATDIAFYESNDSPAFVGHQAINELIGRLQAQWPDGFKFELLLPGRVNHNIQEIRWRLGVPGDSPVATGTDIATIADGKISALYLFLDIK